MKTGKDAAQIDEIDESKESEETTQRGSQPSIRSQRLISAPLLKSNVTSDQLEYQKDDSKELLIRRQDGGATLEN